MSFDTRQIILFYRSYSLQGGRDWLDQVWWFNTSIALHHWQRFLFSISFAESWFILSRSPTFCIRHSTLAITHSIDLIEFNSNQFEKLFPSQIERFSLCAHRIPFVCARNFLESSLANFVIYIAFFLFLVVVIFVLLVFGYFNHPQLVFYFRCQIWIYDLIRLFLLLSSSISSIRCLPLGGRFFCAPVRINYPRISVVFSCPFVYRLFFSLAC